MSTQGLHKVRIHIDEDKVRLPEGRHAVAELKHLVDPPIGDDRDIFRDIDGAPDERIDDNEEVTLTKGAEFYSVPRVIAPGAPA